MEENRFYCRSFISPPAAPPPAPPGPEWTRPGALSWDDQGLERAFCRSRGGFFRQETDGGFALAYPLNCRQPFPLPPLFCFARAECLGGRGWWVFSFAPGGAPRFQTGEYGI